MAAALILVSKWLTLVGVVGSEVSALTLATHKYGLMSNDQSEFWPLVKVNEPLSCPAVVDGNVRPNATRRLLKVTIQRDFMPGLSRFMGAWIVLTGRPPVALRP